MRTTRSFPIRVLFILCTSLLFLSGCSLFKAPSSGDFTRVKYRPHLSSAPETDTADVPERVEAPDRIAEGPQAFLKNEVGAVTPKTLHPEPQKAEAPKEGSGPEQSGTGEPLASADDSAGAGESPSRSLSEEFPIPYELDAFQEERKKGLEGLDRSKSSEGTDDLLLLILCILLPPLAVYLVFDIGQTFWISVILTLIVWVPGIVYSIIVIGQKKGWFD